MKKIKKAFKSFLFVLIAFFSTCTAVSAYSYITSDGENNNPFVTDVKAADVTGWIQTGYDRVGSIWSKTYYKIVKYDINGNATVQLRAEMGADAGAINYWTSDQDIYINGKWKATWKFPRKNQIIISGGTNNQYYTLTLASGYNYHVKLANVNVDPDQVTNAPQEFYLNVPALDKTLTVNPNGGTWGYDSVQNPTTSTYEDSRWTATVSNLRSDGYTVTLKFKSNFNLSGVTEVRMPTWSGAGGQDDLIWHSVKISNRTATLNVSVADHKFDMGAYYTHFYLFRNGKQEACGGLNSITVPTTPYGSAYFPGKSTSTRTFKLRSNETKSIPVPTRSGYTFTGWSVSGSAGSWSGSTTGNSSFKMGNSNVTLTANWKINNFTVTYKANGGTGADQKQTITGNTSWTTKGANTFSKSYYYLSSWNTKADGSGTKYSVNAKQPGRTSNLTLYAQWTPLSYNLTVNPNGGTYNGKTSSTTTSHQYTSTVNVANPTRTGYTFLGWNQNGFSSNPTGMFVRNGYTSNFATSVGNKVTNRYETYTHYELNNITSSKDYWSHISFGSYSVSAGETVTITGKIRVTSNVPQGINFYHGATSNDYNNNQLHIGGTTDGWQEFTLTRTFTSASSSAYFEIYTGNLNGTNNDSLQFDLKEVKITKSDGSNKLTDRFTMPHNAVTLTAQWRANQYKVEYNGNGADSGYVEGQVATYDKEFTLNKNNFTRKNYDFIGWNTKADGSGKSYSDQQVVKNLVPSGTCTLYAQWEAQKYTVVFKGNGNDGGSMPDQKISWDKPTKLNKNEYTRDKSDFIGWNTEPDGSGTWFKDEETVTNLTDGNKTFIIYAQWDDEPVLKTRPGAYMVNTDLPIDKIIDENASATDREDEDIEEKIIVTQIRYNDTGTIVKNPTSIDSSHARTVEVTYQVTDSYGHTKTKTDTVTIISLEYEDAPGDDGNNPMIYSRFIADGYQDTLESNSKWNHEDDYKNALTSALQKAKEKWNAWLNQ